MMSMPPQDIILIWTSMTGPGRNGMKPPRYLDTKEIIQGALLIEVPLLCQA